MAKTACGRPLIAEAARASSTAARSRFSMMSLAVVLTPISRVAPKTSMATTIAAITISGITTLARSFRLSVFMAIFFDVDRGRHCAGPKAKLIRCRGRPRHQRNVGRGLFGQALERAADNRFCGNRHQS